MIMKKNNVVQLTKEDAQTSNVFNALISTLRTKLGAALYGQSPDGKRNYNALFGYPDNPSYADFRGMYRRGGIAHTVVSKVAKACWREVPEIIENEESVKEDLITALKEVGLFAAFERADILNRIGTISVLFIGVQDGLEPKEPISNGGNLEDVYFNVYGEDGITITQWDTDAYSKRFGLPIMYQLQTTNLESGAASKAIGLASISVHYSRIVHLAEGALETPIEGISALEPVYNALIDKDKVRGAAPEAFFRNARQKFALIADKDSNIDTSVEGKAALQDEIEAFTNNQQDFLRLKNMTIDTLQPQIADPKGAYDICVEEISGQTGIPVRILTGKGGGQTNGTEDKASWNALVGDRQDSQCTPWFIASLRVLEEANVIEALPDTLSVDWPEQSALTEKEKSEVNDNKASALQKLASARSVAGGDEIDLKSALKAFDLEDIKIDNTVPTGITEDE